MRICIDARWIGARIAGIGRYTVYLMRYLAELGGGNSYIALFHDAAVRDAVCAELGLAGRLGVVRVVVLVAIDKHHQVCILLDCA